MNRDELDIATRVLGQIFRNYLIELQTAGGVTPFRAAALTSLSRISRSLPGIGMGNGMTLPAPLASLIFGVPRRSDLVDVTIACIGTKLRRTPSNCALSFSSLGSTTTCGALAEDELLDFQEAPQIALVDLLGIHLEDLALVEENHLVDGVFALVHGGESNAGK